MNTLKLKYKFLNTLALVAFTAVLCVVNAFTSGNKAVEPEQYLEVYRANKEKLSKTEIVDKAEYNVLYVPTEVRLINLDLNGNMTEALYESFLTDRKAYLEFILQLKIPEVGSNFLEYEFDGSTTYEERLKYYSFGMQQDLSLIVDNKDTISCSDFVYEPNFGASPKASFIIGFSGVEHYNTIDIMLTNRMTGDSEVAFHFSQKDFKILPTLKKYDKWKK